MILVGRGKAYVICIIRHRRHAKGYVRNKCSMFSLESHKCSMVSSESHKQHLLYPVRFLLAIVFAQQYLSIEEVRNHIFLNLLLDL
jgi:hypothetical protein